MRSIRRAPGELQAEVLDVLWSIGQPATPEQIRAEVDPALAYSTIRTIVTRLLEKGEVIRHSTETGFAYEPADERVLRTAYQVHELLGSGNNRFAVLRCFVSSMKPNEKHELRQLLDDTDEHN